MHPRISILSLLLSSNGHKDALLKTLNESYLRYEVIRTNTITFTKDKVAFDGTRYVKSLHIFIECKGMIITQVLIDNGFALNVCPYVTLEQLGVEYPSPQ